MPDTEIRTSLLARCNHKEVTNMNIQIFRKNVNITNDRRNDETAYRNVRRNDETVYGNDRLEPSHFFKYFPNS
jgi:hypothetical protein